MKKDDFRELTRKYLAGQASPAEKRLLDEYYSRLSSNINPLPANEEERLRKKMLDEILNYTGIRKTKVFAIGKNWVKWAAAVVVIILGTGSYFLFFNRSVKQIVIAVIKPVQDIKAPGTNKAILTLAGGRQIILDSAQKGSMAAQGNTEVMKVADGEIVYNRNRKLQSGEILYNTLTNPRGSKVISLVLSDGTKVWLNTESSLRYPTTFSGDQRRVEITGEAYFEVAHNPVMPFVVSKETTSVQVLGTHFNVNSYDDEKELKVTLLQGSVKVSKNKLENILKPGQQAQVTDKIQIEKNVNLGQIMAWKNGFFQFKDASLQTVLRELGRWYDLDISYQEAIPDDRFVGKVGRDYSLSEVLDILGASDVHFTIEGKHMIVQP